MDVRKEIKNHAAKEDKPILNWLFDHYSLNWFFVAACTHERYGRMSYQTNRVWKPTKEGYALYHHFTTAKATWPGAKWVDHKAYRTKTKKD